MFSDFIQSSIGRAVYVKVVLGFSFGQSTKKVKRAVLFFLCPVVGKAPVKFSLSNPMFVCLANPMAIRVEGIMLFLMIFQSRKADARTFNFKSTPYSETLKNRLFD
jgi:hypothetical protein